MLNRLKDERALLRWLRGKLDQFGHIQPIESSTGSGIPDVNFAFKDFEGWTELKVLHKKLYIDNDSPIFIPHLREQQVAWIARRWACGGNVSLTIALLESIAVISGIHIIDLASGKITWRKLMYERRCPVFGHDIRSEALLEIYKGVRDHG